MPHRNHKRYAPHAALSAMAAIKKPILKVNNRNLEIVFKETAKLDKAQRGEMRMYMAEGIEITIANLKGNYFKVF